MTAKEKVLNEVGSWTEEQAARALRAVAGTNEDPNRWLDELPEDDEVLTPEEEAAVSESAAEVLAGRVSSLDEVKQELRIR